MEIVALRRTLSANHSIRAEDYFQSSIPFNHSESGRKEYYENMNISALFIENIPISCRKKGRPPFVFRGILNHRCNLNSYGDDYFTGNDLATQVTYYSAFCPSCQRLFNKSTKNPANEQIAL